MRNSNIEKSGVKRQGSRVKRKAFTLIEILIYMALVSITIGGSLFIVFNLLEGNEKLQWIAIREEEASFILKKIEWILVDAETINTPASGASGSTLSITKTNFAGNPVIMALDSGNVTLKAGAGSAQILNSSSFPVTALSFTHLAPASGKPAGIHMTFTGSGEEYSTTIHLRK